MSYTDAANMLSHAAQLSKGHALLVTHNVHAQITPYIDVGVTLGDRENVRNEISCHDESKILCM